MAKHRLEDKKLEAVKVDTTLYDRGLAPEPHLLPVETTDKQLADTIAANRARRAEMLYSMRSLTTAGLFLLARGEKFNIEIEVPNG